MCPFGDKRPVKCAQTGNKDHHRPDIKYTKYQKFNSQFATLYNKIKLGKFEKIVCRLGGSIKSEGLKKTETGQFGMPAMLKGSSCTMLKPKPENIQGNQCNIAMATNTIYQQQHAMYNA